MDTLVAIKHHLKKMSRQEILQLSNELEGQVGFDLLYDVSKGRYKSDIGYSKVQRIADRLARRGLKV